MKKRASPYEIIKYLFIIQPNIGISNNNNDSIYCVSYFYIEMAEIKRFFWLLGFIQKLNLFSSRVYFVIN